MLKYISRLYLVIFILFLLIYVTREFLNFSNVDNYWVILSFVPTSIIGIFCLAASFIGGSITLYSIHWYFVLLFFVFVPLLQFINNKFLYVLDSNSIIMGNIYICLWCIFFTISYNRTVKLDNKVKEHFSIFRLILHDKINNKLHLLIGIAVIISLTMVMIGGFNAFFTRASYSNFVEEIGGWGPLSLIIRNYLQPLVFCIFIVCFGLLIYSKTKLTYLLLMNVIILALILPITNNLLMFPRFYAFAILLGVIMIILQRYNKNSALVYLLILFVGLPLSSAVDQFRSMTSLSINDLRLNINWDFLFYGHFDAYEMFIHTIGYVSENGIVYGKQLIGALLFFIPRSIWEEKPVGSGHFAAEYLNNYFQVLNYNVGFPLVAEMFINFHILGVVFGALFYGFISGSLDKHYNNLIAKLKYNHDKEFDFYILLHPFLIGLFLFHLRGDYISSFAYTVGFVCAFLTVLVFLKFKIKQ